MRFTAFFATVALAVVFPAHGAAETVVIHSQVDSSKCLDVRGDDPRVGQTVQMYDCNNTRAQKWIFAPERRVPQELRFKDNLCAYASPANTTLQDGSEFPQSWVYNPFAATLTTATTEGLKCLTWQGGYEVFLRDCIPDVNQRWTLV